MASQWVHLDSNQGPAGYEPDALTAELWTREPPGHGGTEYSKGGGPKPAPGRGRERAAFARLVPR